MKAVAFGRDMRAAGALLLALLVNCGHLAAPTTEGERGVTSGRGGTESWSGTSSSGANAGGGRTGTGPIEYCYDPFCEATVTCVDGGVAISERCANSTVSCELGCRSELRTELGWTGRLCALAELSAFGYAVLCEEFRVQNGPRRPGDPCTTDLDCLPFPLLVGALSEDPVFSQPYPRSLNCSQGACRERQNAASDYGAPCSPSWSTPATAERFVGEDERCESAICFGDDDAYEGACTMSCVTPADCPPGSDCEPITVSPGISLCARSDSAGGAGGAP